MKTAQLTPWFPAKTRPVRAGIYQTRIRRFPPVERLWDGAAWIYGGCAHCHTQDRQWRGLANPPEVA